MEDKFSKFLKCVWFLIRFVICGKTRHFRANHPRKRGDKDDKQSNRDGKA